jgi:hypothetical protein
MKIVQSGDSPRLRLVYGYKSAALTYDSVSLVHARILGHLADAKAHAAVENFEIHELHEGFDQSTEGKELLSQVREFAIRRRIRVRFGSRKYPYDWFPLQFLLGYRGGELSQAFPCLLEGGYVQPEEFLVHLLAGEP